LDYLNNHSALIVSRDGRTWLLQDADLIVVNHFHYKITGLEKNKT